MYQPDEMHFSMMCTFVGINPLKTAVFKDPVRTAL